MNAGVRYPGDVVGDMWLREGMSIFFNAEHVSEHSDVLNVGMTVGDIQSPHKRIGNIKDHVEHGHQFQFTILDPRGMPSTRRLDDVTSSEYVASTLVRGVKFTFRPMEGVSFFDCEVKAYVEILNVKNVKEAFLWSLSGSRYHSFKWMKDELFYFSGQSLKTVEYADSLMAIET